MKKYIVLIVIAVVLILSACIVINAVMEPELPTLSEELKKEIQDAWSDQNDGRTLSKWGPELRYYGSYGGVTVLFEGGPLFASETKRIALSSFWYQNSFVLWAYADGTFIPLEDAYAANKIGIFDIATIAKIHRAYHDVYFGHMSYGG